MCLAIPGKITEIGEDSLATVDILGVTREVALDLTPQAQLGDYVLVHAGFAIEVVDADYALETIELIKELPQLAGEDLFA
ncbi:MAG: HypC/HybG/HupF family hydrogenase formation chaperone [Eggerthellaceae bacterium]|nr:HypC/HybG/HupF family hydrogenase formation chaperone [Eggerthellaceae bacterium]